MSDTAPCDDCGSTISREATRCPSCGYEPATRGRRAGWLALAVSIPVLLITTAVLGYLSLFALLQGTFGRMRPFVALLAALWLAAALVVAVVRKQRNTTPTDATVL